MSDYKRATILGTLGDADIFMTGFALQYDDPAVDCAELVQLGLAPALEARWGGGVIFNSVRVDEIDKATNTVLDTATVPFAGGVPEGGGGNMLPPEVAVCVTIESLGPGGRKGRFYLPPPTVSRCGLYGRVDHTWRDSLCVALQDTFQTALGAAGTPARLSVYSKKDHELYGATAISIGDVFDSQRRRRNKMVENRTRHTIG